MTQSDFIEFCETHIGCSSEKAIQMWDEATKFHSCIEGIQNPVMITGEDEKGKWMLIKEKGHDRISELFCID